MDTYPIINSESQVIRLNETHRIASVPVILSVSEGLGSPIPFEIYAQIGAFLAYKHFNERDGVILPWLPQTLQQCDLYLHSSFRHASLNPLTAAKRYYDLFTKQDKHSLQSMSPLAINCCSTSTETQLVGTLGTTWDIPIVSNHASSPVLDESDMYPSVTLLHTTDSGDSTTVVSLFSKLRAAHFVCIYVRDEFGIGFHSAVNSQALSVGMTVVSIPFEQDASQQDIQHMMDTMMPRDVRYVFWRALEELNGGLELNKARDGDLIRAMQGISRVELQVPLNPKVDQFMLDFQFDLDVQSEVIKWMSTDIDPAFLEEDYIFSEHIPLTSNYTAYSYDDFMAIALGACSIEKDFPTNKEVHEAIQAIY